jgi:hypothetical protein
MRRSKQSRVTPVAALLLRRKNPKKNLKRNPKSSKLRRHQLIWLNLYWSKFSFSKCQMTKKSSMWLSSKTKTTARRGYSTKLSSI